MIENLEVAFAAGPTHRKDTELRPAKKRFWATVFRENPSGRDVNVILPAEIDYRQLRGDMTAKLHIGCLVEVKLGHGSRARRRPPGICAVRLRLKSRKKETLS